MNLIDFGEFQTKDQKEKTENKKKKEKKPKKEKKQTERVFVSEEGYIMVGNRKVRYNSDLMRTIHYLLFGASSRKTILDLARQYLQIMEMIIHKELEKKS